MNRTAQYEYNGAVDITAPPPALTPLRPPRTPPHTGDGRAKLKINDSEK